MNIDKLTKKCELRGYVINTRRSMNSRIRTAATVSLIHSTNLNWIVTKHVLYMYLRAFLWSNSSTVQWAYINENCTNFDLKKLESKFLKKQLLRFISASENNSHCLSFSSHGEQLTHAQSLALYLIAFGRLLSFLSPNRFVCLFQISHWILLCTTLNYRHTLQIHWTVLIVENLF